MLHPYEKSILAKCQCNEMIFRGRYQMLKLSPKAANDNNEHAVIICMITEHADLSM